MDMLIGGLKAGALAPFATVNIAANPQVKEVRTADDVRDLLGKNYHESFTLGENIGYAIRTLCLEDTKRAIVFYNFDLAILPSYSQCTCIESSVELIWTPVYEWATARGHIEFKNCRLLEGRLRYFKGDIAASPGASAEKLSG